MDAVAAGLCAHEAGHAAAALVLGRRVIYASRTANQCGEVYSTGGVAEGIVTLIVPMFVAPVWLSHLDLEKVDEIASMGVDVQPAYAQARRLSQRPDFRQAFRAIETALYSRPILSGEECELLIALDKERA